MIINDFENIKYFTINELQSVDNVKNINAELIFRLDRLRGLIGKPIKILSINGGEHTPNSYHYQKKAIDFYIGTDITDVEALHIIMLLAYVGFVGIGVYKNKLGIYSFHADLRDGKLTTWKGIKDRNNKWIYSQLFLNI